MGVGQAETTVYDMVDIFLVLLLPSGGDELQGIKKGIIEMADVIIINKADGNLKNTAEITMLEYKNAQNMISNIREDISPGSFSMFVYGVNWHHKNMALHQKNLKR